MSSNLLNVRIIVEHLKITKMLQFENSIPISEVINQVQTKIQDSVKANTKPEDYSIFRNSTEDEKVGYWLNKQASLADYSVKQGDELIYKEVNRLLRFKLPDESLKTIIVNETKVLGEILKIICNRCGISNIDEYSLAVEAIVQDDKNLTNTSQKDAPTGTMKKKSSIGLTLKKIEEREMKKMEKMKHKLHTNDDIRWVEHDKTLSEQGIDPSDILILRRKYFYESNRNVVDPFEMNILYKQCEEAVLKGTLMVNEEEVIQLSALQLRIQKGVVDDAAFKNSIDLKEYLPKEYQKNLKSIEKKIKEYYKTIDQLSVPECKQKYTAICQNSKMYGTSIFLVKEKIPGKQKLGPVLLGITKESVMRMDEKTKDILKTWELTCIRRWAASPNSFTLDFGEYDENYSVMTSESEQISKLISGYIDLILKKKKIQAAEMATAGVALVEENITPGQGIFMSVGGQSDRAKVSGQGKRAQITERVAGAKVGPNSSGIASTSRLYGRGRAQRIKQNQVQKFSTPQKALVCKMTQLLNSIPSDDQNIIDNSRDDPTIGRAKSPESYQLLQRQILGASLSSMAVALSNVMNNVQDKDKINYTSLSNNAVELNDAYLKILQSCADLSLNDSEEKRENLDKMLKEFSGNFKNFINAFCLKEDEISDIDKKTFNLSFNAISMNLRDMMKHFGLEHTSDELTAIINLQTKNLSLSASKLITEAMKISNECQDKETKDKIESKIIDMKNQLSLITATNPMLSATLYDEQTLVYFCNQLEELDRRIRCLTEACEENKTYSDFSHMKKSAEDMQIALDNLLNGVKEALDNKSKNEINKLLLNIMDLMNESENDNLNLDEIKDLSKNLTLNLGKVLTILKNEINQESDEQIKHDLFVAAKSLADATKILLDNSKTIQEEDTNLDIIKNDHNKTVGNINEILSTHFANEYDNARAFYVKKCLDRLISATILMDSAMEKATESCRSENLENSLWDNVEEISLCLQNMIDSLDQLIKNPTSKYRKEDLMLRAIELCNVGKKAITTSKNAVPLVADYDHAAFLNKAIRAMSLAVEDVEKCVGNRDNLSDEEKTEMARERINDVSNELEKIKSKINSGTMENFQAENKEYYDSQLMTIYRDIMKIQGQLTDPSYTEDVAGLANSLEKLSILYHKLLNPLYGSSACSQKDENLNVECKSLIDNIQNVVKSTLTCCKLTESMYENNEKSLPDDLLSALRHNSDSMLKLFDNLPLNKDIENAVHAIEKVNKIHQSKMPGLPSRNLTYAEQQKEISRSISSILEQVAEMLRVAYKEDVPKFTPIFNTFSENYAKIYDQVKCLASSTSDKNTTNIINESLSTVVNSCNRLTSTVKLFTSDPNPASKIFFSEAAKNFSDELSSMLLKIISSKPGRRECEGIKNSLQFSLRPLIESSDKEILPDKTYSACVEDIKKLNTSKLGQIEKNIRSHISSEKNMGDIKAAVDEFGKFIDDIVKNTAQASYILGMTDGSSTTGRAQIFDEEEIRKNVIEIQKCFESLPKAQKELKSADIETFKKDLQKYSGNLIRSSKNSVDSLTGNPVIQKELLDIVNLIANSVKDTVNEFKNFESFSNDVELKTKSNKCKDNVLKSAEKLIKLIESEGVKYIPARIGERGKQMQEPVIVDGFRFVESSLATVELLSNIIDIYDDHTKDEVEKHLYASKRNLENLIETLKSNGPGENLYSEMISRLHELNEDLKIKREKSMNSISPIGSSSKEFEARFEMLSTKIQAELKDLSKLTDKSMHLRAGKFENIINLFDGLPETINSLCSSFTNISKEEKENLYDILSDICKEMSHAINSCRINPQNIEGEQPKEFYRALDATLKKCELLSHTIGVISEKSNILQGIINNFEKINNSLDISGISASKSDLTPYQEEEIISECLKSILKDCQELSTKGGEKSEIVNARCQNLFDKHEKCSALVFSNHGKIQGEEINQIRKNYILLGANIKDLFEKLKSVESSSDSDKQRDLNQQVKKISQNISTILKLIQLSHKGVEACSKIADIVNDNISEIETCILFAENKALEKEPNSLPISSMKEPIITCAQQISQILAELKKGRDFSDPSLLKASSSLFDNTKLLFDYSKKAAISLGVGESDHQISLLEATKNFGSSMSDLLTSLKEGPRLQTEKEKNVIIEKINKTESSLNNCIKKINSIDEISSKSSAVIDQAINHIEKMVDYLNPNKPCQWDNDVVNTKPEDVVRISKDIPFSLAKMTQAINSGKTKDLEDNVKKGENVFEELIKGVRKFVLASNEETVKSVNECLKQSTISYLALLKNIKENSANPDKAKIQELSKAATQDIFKFVKTCSDLKAEQFADMNDPQLLAERELLNAAASIELAAKKLAELKPRKVSTDTPDKELNFDGQILQAVQSIMKATSLLVTYASSAQKELVAKGVLKEAKASDTGQWSQGLISAARLVAESTHFLCDEAKNAVEGKGNEERMIAACNSIFGSTSQLIMACKVKADPNSENQARLEKAGAAVKKASKGLVESLKGSGIFSEEKKEVEVDKTQVGGMKQMLDALEEVARREKELTEAREKLIKLRQAKPQ